MADSIKQAFKLALKKQREKSISTEETTSAIENSLKSLGDSSPKKNAGGVGNGIPAGREGRSEVRHKPSVSYGHVAPRTSRRSANVTHQEIKLPNNLISRPQSGRPAPKLAKKDVADQAAPAIVPTLSVSPTATCLLVARPRHDVSLLPHCLPKSRGIKSLPSAIGDEREVVLGLDFGTSCVKVVIGDAALGKSFAVPFCNVEGIERYLLPSCVYQTVDAFSIETGTNQYRDLKLSLLANPDDRVAQRRVVALLAIVISRACSWLLSERADDYVNTKVVWKLSVGLPAAQHLQTPLSELFGQLGCAAWVLATASKTITENAIDIALDEAFSKSTSVNDTEVSIVPEIAAQIYGFVVSNSFDRKAHNIYLMADVGAGTVDAALFHVKPSKGGRWDFEFYTSVVEPNGVSNLHRHRVNWWTEELSKAGASNELSAGLEASRLVTDQRFPVPERYLDYFQGINVTIPDAQESPDVFFFSKHVLAQIQGKALIRAWRDKLLPQHQMTEIPLFLVGGGVRMRFYQELESRLASIPGVTWTKAKRRNMEVPGDLIADGVVGSDYDRLSVAYGLSRLEVGRVVKALPVPKLETPPVSSWRDNYIDKDHC